MDTKLPAELRNRIYEHAFVDEEYCICDPSSPHATHSMNCAEDEHTKLCAENEMIRFKRHGLLDTCRLFRKEAEAMWYSKLHIHISCAADLIHWLKGIGEKRAALLKSVVVENHEVESLDDDEEDEAEEDALPFRRRRLDPELFLRRWGEEFKDAGIDLGEGVLKVSFEFCDQRIISTTPRMDQVEAIKERLKPFI